MELDKLQQSIESIIKYDNFDTNNLKIILFPISVYVESNIFSRNIKEIVDIVIKDRNRNRKFDVNDLEILSKDTIAVLSLSSSILFVIATLPEQKFKHNKLITEQLIYKLLIYIFLVIIPIETKKPFTFEEKKIIMNLTLSMYQLICSSNTLQTMVANINSYFKTNGLNCCTSKITNDEVIDNKFPEVKLNLTKSMDNIRHISDIHIQIANLEQKSLKKRK